jgi:hypothetical protein
VELAGTRPLEWWLEDSQNAKKSWSPKNFLVPIPQVQPIGWFVTEKFGLLLNALLNLIRVLNLKC